RRLGWGLICPRRASRGTPPRPKQLVAGGDADLRQQAFTQQVLLLGLVVATGLHQQADQGGPGLFVVGGGEGQGAGKGQRPLRVAGQATDQGGENTAPGPGDPFPLGDAPGVKAVEVGEFQTLEKIAATAAGRLFQVGGGNLPQV